MTFSGLFYLATALLWWWLGSFAFGIVVGAFTSGKGPRSAFLPWIVMLAVSIGLSYSQVFSGRAGLWFDTAVLIVGLYFIGCCLGALLGQQLRGTERIVSSDVPLPVPPVPATVPTIKPYQWQALKQEGALTLTGYVPSPAIKTRIMAAAKALLPKLTVVDRLQTGAGAPDALESFAGAAFGHLARLESGTASLVDLSYTLTGLAKTEIAKAAVVKMTGSLPAGYMLARADISLPVSVSDAMPAVATLIPAVTPLVDPGIVKPVETLQAKSPALSDAPPPDTAKPEGMAAPRAGQADDLKRIRGIGRQNEGRLHELGIWHFDQIAQWTADEVAWVGHFLAFPGRIEREQWVDQARTLAGGQETGFSRHADRGSVETSAGPTNELPLVVEPMLPAPTPAASDIEPKGRDIASGSVDASYRVANALVEARNGKPDRLVYINGIDEATEGKLNAAGIFHFDQLAQMSKDDLIALSAALGHPDKAIEDNWKGEAAMLAIGSETDHSKAMKAASGSLNTVVPKKD